jgi:hypothetical protein
VGLDPMPPVLLARQMAAIERLTVEAWLAGVAGFGVFALTPYADGAQDFGLSNAGGSGRPALTRYLDMTRRLPGCEPRFALRRHGSGESIGAVMATPDGRWWTMLWTPNRRDALLLPSAAEAPQPAAISETSQWATELVLPEPADRWRIGHAAEERLVQSRLAVALSAATNLHLHGPPVRFGIRDVEWVPMASRARREPGRSEPSPVVVQWVSEAAHSDKVDLCHRFPRGSVIRMKARFFNFSAEPQVGSVTWRLPEGWSIATKMSRRLRVEPQSALSLPIELRVPRGVRSSMRYDVVVEWRSDSGARDVASIRLAPEADGSERFFDLEAVWSDDVGGARWERFKAQGDGIGLRFAEGSAGRPAGLISVLPAGFRLQDDDVLRFRVRLVEGVHPSGVRCELITPGRVVRAMVRDTDITPDGVALDFRVGDFTPAFWSHADPDDAVVAADFRYVRIEFGGMPVGTRIELGAIQRLR